MEECGGDEAPPVAVGDERPVERELAEQPSTGLIHPEPLRDGDEVDDDVEAR